MKLVALSAVPVPRRLLFAIVCLVSLVCPLLNADDDVLLPPANDFRLTVVGVHHSTVPLGPGCTGEAEQTLTCRALVVTLENLSKKTVRISWPDCSEAPIQIDRKEPNSGRGWESVSTLRPGTCRPMAWAGFRLRPGEKNVQSLRLNSPHRYSRAFEPGSYTLRALWTLSGCTEEPEGEDCLAALQAVHPPNSVSSFGFQKSVLVTSNELTVDAPVLPPLGTLKLGFEVTARRGPPPGTEFARKSVDCIGDANASIDCIVFHYVIRNLGDRPVRYMGSTCTGVHITPEYRTPAAEWEPVPSFSDRLHEWVCVSNRNFERPILPGGTSEGDFVLSSLPFGYDVTDLRAAADYLLRFTYWPRACFASPDGSFCLTKAEEVAPVPSPEVSIPLIAAYR